MQRSWLSWTASVLILGLGGLGHTEVQSLAGGWIVDPPAIYTGDSDIPMMHYSR